MIMSVGAIVGFAVYYEMVGVTFLEHVQSTGIGVSSAIVARTCVVFK